MGAGRRDARRVQRIRPGLGRVPVLEQDLRAHHRDALVRLGSAGHDRQAVLVRASVGIDAEHELRVRVLHREVDRRCVRP